MHEPLEAIESPGTRGINGCEPPVGSGTLTWVLY